MRCDRSLVNSFDDDKRQPAGAQILILIYKEDSLFGMDNCVHAEVGHDWGGYQIRSRQSEKI